MSALRWPAAAGRLRPRRRLLAGLAIIALLGAAGWLWLRDSSLVAIRDVRVLGTGGPDAAAIRSALRRSALNMTTLNVDGGALRAAVEPFPVVKRLQIRTSFPHGLTIEVGEQLAVARAVVGGRAVAVAADGTLLRDVPAGSNLPAIPLRVDPVGTRLTEPDALAAVAVLGAAPWPLLGRVESVRRVPPHGVVASLRSGPSLLFGDLDRLREKWLAATQVLADAGARGAGYVDLSDPGRPAAGASLRGITDQSGRSPTGGARGAGPTG